MLSIDCYHFTPNTGIPLASYEDIVDGDVDELDEEADEAHDGKADRSRLRDLRELCEKKEHARAHTHRSGQAKNQCRH